MNKIAIISVTLVLAMAVGLAGCGAPPAETETVTTTATLTPEEPNWWPDSSKVVVYPRLALENGVIVNIPPDQTRIVPFEIEEGERIQTFHIVAISGGFEQFVRDSKGNFLLKWPLMPWDPGVYYLHIMNESLPSEYCQVELTISFMLIR